MKVPGNRRRCATWLATAASALMLGVWITSMWVGPQLYIVRDGTATTVAVCGCQLILRANDVPDRSLRRCVLARASSGGTALVRWWFKWEKGAEGWFVFIPLWVLFLPILALTVRLWSLH